MSQEYHNLMHGGNLFRSKEKTSVKLIRDDRRRTIKIRSVTFFSCQSVKVKHQKAHIWPRRIQWGGLDIREESFFSLFLCSGLSGLRPMGKSNISDYGQWGRSVNQVHDSVLNAVHIELLEKKRIIQSSWDLHGIVENGKHHRKHGSLRSVVLLTTRRNFESLELSSPSVRLSNSTDFYYEKLLVELLRLLKAWQT